MLGKIRRRKSVWSTPLCLSLLSIPFVIWTITTYLLLHPNHPKDKTSPLGNPGQEIGHSKGNGRRFQFQYSDDEFLAEVLKTVEYTAVDLRSRIDGSYGMYDSEIEKDLNKMRPEFGLPDAIPELPDDIPMDFVDRIVDRDAFNSILSEYIPLNRSVPENPEVA